MRNHYPTRLTCTLLLTGILTISAHGQKPGMVRMMVAVPASSSPINLSDFSLPPYPVELINLGLNPEGALRYQTLMPIAGRMAATTDEAKLKGSLAPPAGIYLYTGAIDTQGQVTPVQAAVFAQPDTRVKVSDDTPIDWAVWGTKATDGPLRLPYGGGYDLLPSVARPGRQVKQVSLTTSGSGLNYANYSLYPTYRIINRFIDPVSIRLVSRLEDVPLQQAANQEKLLRYIPVEGDTPEDRGRVIAVSASANRPTRFEGVATRFVKGDKNASARQVSLLTFDDAGNLLGEQAINFPYSRKLAMRLPVHDPAGKVVGTFSVFADGGGKKDARDPQENRFSVVVTDEQGSIWSQFEWTNGEGSIRAVIPAYALRRGDNLLVYNNNAQKLLKSVEETWLFDKSGKATLVGSMPYGEVADHSSLVVDSPTNVLSGAQRAEASKPGWFNFSAGRYLDSFTDATGDIWVLFQRQDDAPGGRAVVAESPASSPTSKLMGFANKLNQIAGQPSRALTPVTVTSESGKTYTDLFVLHFDADLKLKEQTVVELPSTPEPVRFQRSIRSEGSADYVLSNSATTWLRLRKGPTDRLSVKRLSPYESVSITIPDRDNFLLDAASGKIYVLCGIPRKPGLGQLLTYNLD
ncbi:hypothetical protein [Spirosoma endbachense]|uniref:Uncharacterized protein n=1 Tax=Spirosoma endbachense TaxID=2666025 RepID=A0A6P1W4D1_9BACT|nr:hypothetical protein [Spirosoma endbachense]QHV98790.1 hypothetical protein GJR95_28975 [Spirosoma endbachense]